MVPIPVQLSVSTPGPKYSMTDPVPPLTVRMSATLRMISVRAEKSAPESRGKSDSRYSPFGDDHPLSWPVSFTPMILGADTS